MIHVYCDGASRGNGTDPQGAIGVVVYRNSKLVAQYAKALGPVSNNQAEYEAITTSALICWAADLPDPIIHSDSRLVVNQINGIWKCKQKSLLPYYLSIAEIKSEYRFRLTWVGRGQVGEADDLANEMLDKLEAESHKRWPQT